MYHLQVVKFLVENGADIHTRNEKPLKYACTNRHFEIVKYLVEKGADRNVIENVECLRYLKWIDKIKDRKARIIQKYYRKS